MEIETLGDAWTHGLKAKMACAYGNREGLKSIRECTYRLDLNMETLIATRGRDFPIARLAERLRCPRCGSRQIRVIWDLPSQGDRRAGRAGA
jgi:hypothetical protein